MEKLADLRFFDALTNVQNMRFVLNDDSYRDLSNSDVGYRDAGMPAGIPGRPMDGGYPNEKDANYWPEPDQRTAHQVEYPTSTVKYSTSTQAIAQRVIKAMRSGVMSLSEGYKLLQKVGLDDVLLSLIFDHFR